MLKRRPRKRPRFPNRPPRPNRGKPRPATAGGRQGAIAPPFPTRPSCQGSLRRLTKRKNLGQKNPGRKRPSRKHPDRRSSRQNLADKRALPPSVRPPPATNP